MIQCAPFCGPVPARGNFVTWNATAPDGARLSTWARQGADGGYRDAHAASGQAALDSRLAVAGSRVIMLVSGVPARARLARRRGATRCCRHGATFLPVRSVADHPVAGLRVKGAPGDLLADRPAGAAGDQPGWSTDAGLAPVATHDLPKLVDPRGTGGDARDQRDAHAAHPGARLPVTGCGRMRCRMSSRNGPPTAVRSDPDRCKGSRCRLWQCWLPAGFLSVRSSSYAVELQ